MTKDYLPNRNFEMSLTFKTTVKQQGLFMIDSTRGGHDRHIFMQNGKIMARIWKGARYQVSLGNTNYADGKWHTVKITCQNGKNCMSKIDGKAGRASNIDHSDFDWGDRINVGRSHDKNIKFTGMMKNIYYKAISG